LGFTCKGYPSQATLEKIDPTNAAEIAEINIVPPIGTQLPVALSNDFDRHQPSWRPKLDFRHEPKTISPANDKILIIVKIVCSVLEFLPRDCLHKTIK
jgi:hypothetical protein